MLMKSKPRIPTHNVWRKSIAQATPKLLWLPQIPSIWGLIFQPQRRSLPPLVFQEDDWNFTAPPRAHSPFLERAVHACRFDHRVPSICGIHNVHRRRVTLPAESSQLFYRKLKLTAVNHLASRLYSLASRTGVSSAGFVMLGDVDMVWYTRRLN